MPQTAEEKAEAERVKADEKRVADEAIAERQRIADLEARASRADDLERELKAAQELLDASAPQAIAPPARFRSRNAEGKLHRVG